MAINKEVEVETEVSTEEFTREILLHLYQADSPQSPEEVTQILWPKHQTPLFTPPTIQNAIEFFVRKGVTEDKSGKFILSQKAKRFVEEAYLPSVLNLSDLPETRDKQQGIIVKNLLPELLRDKLGLSFVFVTWEKPTPTHSFKNTTEIFLFTLPGFVVINGERREVKGGTVLTLPPGNKISLAPHVPDVTLQALLITKPKFNLQDMIVE